MTGSKTSDRFFQLLDLLMVFDHYEAIGTLLFRGSRPLTDREHQVLYPIFGDSLPYDFIRIDERAHFGPRSARFCYVSFHTINGWGRLPDGILVHEAVHVWQYVHRGAVYIPRALSAQRSPAGYNYGGEEALLSTLSAEDFNYEQMADVIADAYRILTGDRPRWLDDRRERDVTPFEPFLIEMSTAVLPTAYLRLPAEDQEGKRL